MKYFLIEKVPVIYNNLFDLVLKFTGSDLEFRILYNYLAHVLTSN